MKTEMAFETSVSTKAEPHYPAENPKELLHEKSKYLVKHSTYQRMFQKVSGVNEVYILSCTNILYNESFEEKLYKFSFSFM